VGANYDIVESVTIHVASVADALPKTVVDFSSKDAESGWAGYKCGQVQCC
jgi:hypothetical protein